MAWAPFCAGQPKVGNLDTEDFNITGLADAAGPAPLGGPSSSSDVGSQRPSSPTSSSSSAIPGMIMSSDGSAPIGAAGSASSPKLRHELFL